MKRLGTEAHVCESPDSPCKRAMNRQIEIAHASMGTAIDAITQGGGDFYLMEPGDDLTAVELYEGSTPINLTDVENVNYEFAEFAVEDKVWVLYLPMNDAGGPCFFIPNEAWIGEGFQHDLARKAARS